MEQDRQHRRWIEELGDEDLMFLKRFLLASGSLKALAETYGISYPTVRVRLDRLIDKILILDDQEVRGDFERLVRVMCAEGKMDMETMKTLLAAHKKETGGPT